MTLTTSGYLSLISAGTLLCLFSVFGIVSKTDPGNASAITILAFYASVFLASTGTSTLLGLILRRVIGKDRFINHLLVSVRQGVLVAILITSSLVLQSEKLLFWWVELSIVLFLLVVEIYFNVRD